MSKRLLILLVLALSCACGSKHEDKNVSGRTQSLATVASLESAQAQLRFTRILGAAGVESASLAASLRGPEQETLVAALLRLPGTTEVSLARAGAGDWTGELALASAAERAALLVSGSYTFLWRDASGGTGALGLVSDVGFPDYPSFVSPSEGAVVVGPARVQWEGAVSELRVLDASGELVHERDGLGATEATLPALPPGSYRVVLSAQAGPPSARWSSESVLSFEQVR
ncbi:MAG TPA: hypothetical protein DEA08_13565 [Planctomycetes bacterium]|nr:hypothetical protein [Planctomycetota bacterium]